MRSRLARGTAPRLDACTLMDRQNRARYRAVEERDLGWSVIDTVTGHVLLVRNLPMLCLSESAARALADFANQFGNLISTLH